MRAPAFLVYTAGRMGVFLLTAGLLWLLGFRSWFLVLGAVLLSMPLSYFLLRRQRAAFAESVERRMQERRRLRAKLRGDEPGQ